jgi:hypothetical protein
MDRFNMGALIQSAHELLWFERALLAALMKAWWVRKPRSPHT